MSLMAAYWGDRRESAAEGARRLSVCLNRLGEIHPLLGSWFNKGRSRATARTPVNSDEQSLTAFLEKGRNRRDDNKEVIEELGFNVGLWNGNEFSVGLSASIGTYTGLPGLMNSFVLSANPEDPDLADPLTQPIVAQRILFAMVEAWDPDWAICTTRRLENAQSPERREPSIGWLTYLHDCVIDDASPGAVQSFGNGIIITAGDTLEEVDEGTVVDIRDHLRGSGRLRAIPIVQTPRA